MINYSKVILKNFSEDASSNSDHKSNIDAGKTTILQMFAQSLSSDDKVTIKVEYEPVKEFQSLYGNDVINPLEHFCKNPADNALSSKIMCWMFINKEWKP